jgi:hypothetical protein
MKPLLTEAFEQLRRAEHHAANFSDVIGQWIASRTH